MIEKENLRPMFHITGEHGWINDPNGVIKYKDNYHVFYQYYPEATHWGPMHWGHVISKDLMHWERLPIALKPGEKNENVGCFSGSAIEWNDKLWLLYTSASFDEKIGNRQVQSLAVSEDSVNFEKLGIVIGEDKLPDEYAPEDFRDPKIWRKNDKFWAVIAARRKGGKGRILLYSSENLHDWKFVSDLLGVDCQGEMVECPDYIENLGILSFSIQFPIKEGYLHSNVHTSVWMHGKLDYESGKFISDSEGITDYGFDFYAPQSFSGTENNLMIAWMNMWDRTVPSAKYGFAGMLTCVREMSVKNGKLYVKPVIGKTKNVKTIESFNVRDKAITGVLKITISGLKSLNLELRSGEGRGALLYTSGEDFIFDRSNVAHEIIGVEKDENSIKGIRRMPIDDLYHKKEKTEIIVVMDYFSVEIFVDGKSLTSTYYPMVEEDEIKLLVDAEYCKYEREEIL